MEKTTIGMGKSTSYDAHDAHDDELQRFSKRDGATLSGTGRWCNGSGAQERQSATPMRSPHPLLFSKYIPCYPHR
jgi:hypothetical protein